MPRKMILPKENRSSVERVPSDAMLKYGTKNTTWPARGAAQLQYSKSGTCKLITKWMRSYCHANVHASVWC